MKHRSCGQPWLPVLCAVLLAILMVGAFRSSTQAQPRKLDNFGTEFYVAFGPNLGGSEDRNVMDLYLTSRVAARGKIENSLRLLALQDKG